MDWVDTEKIAEMLARQHPHKNYLTINRDELLKLVVGLPGFVGAPVPPNWTYLSSIAFAWVDISSEPEEISQYENMV